MATDTYHEVLDQAWRLIQVLSPDEQLQLIEELREIVQRQISSKTKHSILELEGLGKELWEKVDVDEYIEQERNSWHR
jgi:hypothetical protein